MQGFKVKNLAASQLRGIRRFGRISIFKGPGKLFCILQTRLHPQIYGAPLPVHPRIMQRRGEKKKPGGDCISSFAALSIFIVPPRRAGIRRIRKRVRRSQVGYRATTSPSCYIQRIQIPLIPWASICSRKFVRCALPQRAINNLSRIVSQRPRKYR